MITATQAYQPMVDKGSLDLNLRTWFSRCECGRPLFCNHDHLTCICSNCQWLRIRKDTEQQQQVRLRQTNNLKLKIRWTRLWVGPLPKGVFKMMAIKLEQKSVTTRTSPTCICGHVKHLSSNGLTCCCKVDCPCPCVSYRTDTLDPQQRIRFTKLGWLTEEATYHQQIPQKNGERNERGTN